MIKLVSFIAKNIPSLALILRRALEVSMVLGIKISVEPVLGISSASRFEKVNPPSIER